VANATSFSMTPRHRSHRFYEESPEKITVPLTELLSKLPAAILKELPPGDLSGRSVELPCRDLLSGNTPGLSLGQLSHLLPNLVTVTGVSDLAQKHPLPAGWLALHYKLVTRVEELDLEKPRNVSFSPEESLPKSTSVTMIEAEMIVTKPTEAAKIGQGTMVAEKHPRETGPEKPEMMMRPPKAVTPEPMEPAPKRGFFASLPIFRRNVTAKPSTEDRGPMVSSAAPSEPAMEVALETLWKLDPLDQLADPAALQSLFMTEEKLTLDRVISLAGQLPGLRACVLAHGDQVVCASNTPPGVDLKTLSGQAMTMLAQIKESSSSMGLGTVPGVTLHAEQGALSFLHNGELCLLILHADRGFLPGVRERLQEMLGHLSQAKALPGGPNVQPSLPM